MNVEHEVEKYRGQRPKYDEFRIRLEDLLKQLLQSDVAHVTIEGRTKDVDHFREKITRAGKNYKDPINEVTDLVGIRVIVHQNSHVSKVASIIKNEFSIDESNSVNKAEKLNPDQFAYLSVHLIATINPVRGALPEWQQFRNIKFEVQVRTILQHAWATLEHELVYKAATDAPNSLRRRLNRLIALFELADDEIDRLIDERQKQLEIYTLIASSGPQVAFVPHWRGHYSLHVCKEAPCGHHSYYSHFYHHRRRDDRLGAPRPCLGPGRR